MHLLIQDSTLLFLRWAGQIRDSVGNEYQRIKDVSGEERMTIQTHADAALDVCFENTMPKAKCAFMNLLSSFPPALRCFIRL